MDAKPLVLTLLLVGVFAAFTSAASAECGLLKIDYVDSETISQGQSGGFTFSVYNSGESTQRISASAVCDIHQLQCSFSGISDSTIISPGETRHFSLNVESTGSAGSFSIPAELRGGVSGSSCTAPLPLTLQVNSGNVSAPSTPLTASIDPSGSVSARPGDALLFTITLKNNLNRKIYASISSQDTNPFESTTSFTASDVALQAGETKEISATVRLPPGTPGGRYSWAWQVDAGITADYKVTLPAVEIAVQAPVLDLALLNAPLADECTAVDAGQGRQVQMALKNNGELTGPFDLSISGSSTATRVVSISQAKVEPARSEQVPLTLTISPALHTPVSTYFYNLRGTYQGFIFLNRQLCFSVKAIETSRLELPTQVLIERSRVAITTINVTNNGSTTDTYALTAVQQSDLTMQTQPSSITLTPGQTQTVTVAITSDINTELGNRVLQLTLDGQNYSRSIQLNATVAATGRAGESLMEVTVEREIYIVPGGEKTVEVAVRNLGRQVLRDVTLTLYGLDSTLYSADSETLLAGETGFLNLVVRLPASVSQVSANLTIASGDEFVVVPLTLIASSTANLDFRVDEIVENRDSSGATTSVDLIATVTNNGAAEVSGVQPLLQDVGYIYTQTPAELNLTAGQSSQVRINVKPAREGTEAKSVELQFASGEGATQLHSVALPQLTVQPSNLGWKAAIILILVIGILLLLAKKDSY